MKGYRIVFCLLFTVFCLLFFSSPSHAQTPTLSARPRYSIPTPHPFPCNETAPNDSYWGDDEFHSLRPYQASPCDPSKNDLALFCGNDLFVGDYVTIVKDFDSGSFEQYTYDGSLISASIPFDPNYLNPCLYCNAEGVCAPNPDPDCNPINLQCTTEGSTNECGGSCVDNGSTETCSFTITTSKTIAIDVSGAEFPIMGYTEPSIGNESDPYRVTNSTYTDEETVDHPTKMNEYVSWYLNGVNGRAEYPYLDPSLGCVGEQTDKVGQCLSTRTESDGSLTCLGTWGIPFIPPFQQLSLTPDGKSVCAGDGIYCCVSRILDMESENTPGSGNIVNYSGPAKKLLPFSIQNIERTQEVSDGYESDENNAQIRHSQVVGCYLNLLAWVPEVFGEPQLIVGLPVKCYGTDFFGIFSFLDSLIVDHKRLTDFNGETPPIEDEEEYLGGDFSDWIRDYKEWRGYTCVPFTVYLPVIGHYTFNFCLDNPLEPNIFGNLFSYIPLSSTEDRLGDVRIKPEFASTAPISSAVRIVSMELTNVQNADLFFPHMEESNDLAGLLQKTFAYEGSDPNDILSSGYVPYSPYCDYYETRSNPGDDLFAGELSADVEYTAQVMCTYYNWGGTGDPINPAPIGNLCESLVGGTCVPDTGQWCEVDYGQFDCADGDKCVSGDCVNNPSGSSLCAVDHSYTYECVPEYFTGVNCIELPDPEWCPDNFKCVPINTCSNPEDYPTTQSCMNLVMVNLDLETRTPLADKLWAKLVAGSSGIFRKMFPKIGPESSFEGIYDMPASSNVVYSSANDSDILFVGDPVSQSPGSSAQLYFPHIGGIKEYFLTGMQTLLRPKGMGRQPVFCEGDECLLTNESTETLTSDQCVAISDSTLISTYPNASNYLGAVKDALISYCNIFGETNLAQECYNDLVSRSLQAGVNPAFAMSMWISESACSNYERSTSDLDLDFGYSTAPSQNFSEQIDAYLDHNNPFWTYADRCQGSFDNYSHAFLFVYRAGDSDGICGPDSPEDELAGDGYYELIGDIWWSFLHNVAPTCDMPPNPHNLDCP